MTASLLRDRIVERLVAASLPADDALTCGLERYFTLLARWTARINLTALPVQDPTVEALDKLLVEPLVAAPFVPPSAQHWVDLGSGGGSPALPLRLTSPQGSLTLVESRERKCAFLREAIRALELQRTIVANTRFDDFQVPVPVDVVTIRAVRLDAELETLLRHILRPKGLVLCFGTPVESPHFAMTGQVPLPDGSQLTIAKRVS